MQRDREGQADLLAEAEEMEAVVAQAPGPVHVKAVEFRVDVVELQRVGVIRAVHFIHHTDEHYCRGNLAGGALDVVVDIGVEHPG